MSADVLTSETRMQHDANIKAGSRLERLLLLVCPIESTYLTSAADVGSEAGREERAHAVRTARVSCDAYVASMSARRRQNSESSVAADCSASARSVSARSCSLSCARVSAHKTGRSRVAAKS